MDGAERRVLSRRQERLQRDLQHLDETLQDGPVLLVAIVEQHGGRWSDLFPPVEVAACPLAETSIASGGLPPSDNVVGFAAMRAWRFVRGPVSAQQQQLVDAVARRRSRCRSVAYLEHPFLATATLSPR